MSQIAVLSLDHVALWVADRDTLAAFLCGHMGMHEIERTERFTLVGSDARRGKLTLFVADGPREAGVLGRVVLRVEDVGMAVRALPEGLAVERPSPELALLQAPEGLGLGLVPSRGESPDYDIDHLVLRVPDPHRTLDGLARLGFSRRDGALSIADKELRLEAAPAGLGERPLLNHLAVLVESATELQREAERLGLEITDVVDAPNTLAVFVRGPDGITVEYVEHKPGFSLS